MQQIIILIGLFICHFLADYTHLSTAWMLYAKRLGKPLLPIFIHACVHGVLMFIFLLFLEFTIWLIVTLVVFQIVSHFIIDLLKGRANGWFPLLQDNSNKWHWIIFGLDQLLHAIVIILMFYYLIK